MKIVSIGKGLCRINVRSKEKRKRLARIPDVLIDGNRIIFPEWLTDSIRSIIEPPIKKKSPIPKQAELF